MSHDESHCSTDAISTISDPTAPFALANPDVCQMLVVWWQSHEDWSEHVDRVSRQSWRFAAPSGRKTRCELTKMEANPADHGTFFE